MDVTHKTWKRIIILAGIAIIIILACGLYWHYRYIPGRVTFQEYAPTYLPKGVFVKNKELQDWYIPAGEPTRYTRLFMELSDSTTIAQTKEYPARLYGCTRYAGIRNMTCEKRFTSGNQAYYRVAAISPDSNYLYIELEKESTIIGIQFAPNRHVPYSQQEIEKIIDALSITRYKDLPVIEIDRSII